jgi:hypothetical protein
MCLAQTERDGITLPQVIPDENAYCMKVLDTEFNRTKAFKSPKVTLSVTPQFCDWHTQTQSLHTLHPAPSTPRPALPGFPPISTNIVFCTIGYIWPFIYNFFYGGRKKNIYIVYCFTFFFKLPPLYAVFFAVDFAALFAALHWLLYFLLY